jgi:hypothetical protein
MLMPLAWLQNILIPSIYRWFSQLESSIFKGFSMAMLNNQMVLIDTYWYLLILIDTYWCIYMLTTIVSVPLLPFLPIQNTCKQNIWLQNGDPGDPRI